MSILSVFVLALALSMDAFAVAICKGLNMRKINYRQAVIIAFSFGFFQAMMPLIGYLLGGSAAKYIKPIDHWIIFVILGGIGAKMIYDAVTEDDEDEGFDRNNCRTFDVKKLLILSVATSIDALAAGITFAFIDAKIQVIVALIGVTTFICSLIGVIIGNIFGARFQSKAEIAGGLTLIIIGAKILAEHLGLIG